MKKLSIFLVFGYVIMLLMQSGCIDRPELPVEAYGTIVNELPNIAEAKTPFDFPHAGDMDHSKCEFKDDDFF